MTAIPDGKVIGEVKKTMVSIPALNMKWLSVEITGTSAMVQNRFGEKAKQTIIDTQSAGSVGKKGKKRDKKDFKKLFLDAQHRAIGGWNGIPCAAFRNACISACRLVNFKMTIAKMSIFIESDGLDHDGTPLVRIIKGKPEMKIHAVRNATGVCDMRPRPMWAPGWSLKLRVRYDADQFTERDVLNLLNRAGQQVGIGEGRPDSRESNGMGWGLFKIEGDTRRG